MAKQGIRFDRDQLDFLKDVKGRLAKASADTLSSVGPIALRAIQTIDSYRANSPSELDSRGNPYARRHGSIQTGSIGSRPPYAVGRNTGKFAKSIKGRTTNQYEYAITYVENTEVKRIVEGTKIMLPRNPIVATVMSAAFQQVFKKQMSETFNTKVKNA